MKRNWNEFFEAADKEGTRERGGHRAVSLGFIEYVVEFLQDSESLVVGGAALDYYRGREANDLDILVSEDVYEELKWHNTDMMFREPGYAPDLKQYRSVLHESIQDVLKYKMRTLGIDFLIPKQKTNLFGVIQDNFDINLKTTALKWVDGHIVHMTGEWYRDAIRTKTIHVINERDITRSAQRAKEASARYHMHLGQEVVDELIRQAHVHKEAEKQRAQYNYEVRVWEACNRLKNREK